MNNFILNEVEPWYLGLQNQHLGAQARANYKYISYRRAKCIFLIKFTLFSITWVVIVRQ
ncbi:MAG TPA: hypothetical protein PLI97_11880 [Fluviicola sp.]|nr:hypothetical protein [Fluviicola sp.]